MDAADGASASQSPHHDETPAGLLTDGDDGFPFIHSMSGSFMNEVEMEFDEDGEDDDDEMDDDVDVAHYRQRRADPVQRIIGLIRPSRGEHTHGGPLTADELVALVRNPDLSNLLFSNPAEEEEFIALWNLRDRGRAKDPNRFPKVPSREGIKLMESGAFGTNSHDGRREARKHPLSVRLLERELGLGDWAQRKRDKDLLTQSMIPGTRADKIIHYDDPVYSGQFSDDGRFFYSCCQDFKVRIYDTSHPTEWEHYKTASFPSGIWTLTDATLSSDNRWLAYTSIQSLVSITSTDPADSADPHILHLEGTGRSGDGNGPESFGIWSIRFSGDGRELIAGTSVDSIVVYDIESRRVLHHIYGHADDVNAVCFADKASPHVFYSGSDDTALKVWDRRSLGSGKEAGAFVGHTEGLTYIDSKSDGRYILSNGKEQSMKLWDIRMAKSSARFRTEKSLRRPSYGAFDYRREQYDDWFWDPHPYDNSVVTFRGHEVLRTLIRCHFSPPFSSNSRYVYSGSANGKVYIWNLDATLAATIDVHKATLNSRRKDNHVRHWFDDPRGWCTCVRDVSWHPTASVIVASAWNGWSMSRGTCTIHAFNESAADEGQGESPLSVDCDLRPNEYLFPVGKK
ncbi:hypothetical protein RJ55_06005 [Drechmeria coniospora]|nr:hypothetical protein RJ55_06005 [Drechmeria coniospora]